MRMFIYIVPFLLSTSALSQLKIAFGTGYGMYSMNDLKTFQQELLSDFPSDSKITAEFPGYLYYEASVTSLRNEKFILGGYLTYGSTGGRIHYGDYSGEVSTNQLIRYFSIGAPLGIQVSNDEKSLNCHFDLKPHVTFGALTLEFYSRLGNQHEEESLKFTSFNVGVEPGLTTEKVIKNWGINFFLGYNINFVQGKLFFTEDDQAYLQNENGENIGINLSGLRFALGISYKVF